MSDLIKRQDAIKAINLRARIPHDVASAHYASMAINAIRSVPSADRPSAVDLSNVYSTAYKSGYEKGKADRPQGEWINKHEWGNGFLERECSLCGAMKPILMHTAKINYCPNCGARMKGADDE